MGDGVGRVVELFERFSVQKDGWLFEKIRRNLPELSHCNRSYYASLSIYFEL